MILSAQELRDVRPVYPFVERTVARGMTYGVGPAGYDIRIAQDLRLGPGGFALASTVEVFAMPDDILGVVHDKSTWARRGLTVQNTVIEPGWRGYLTLELAVHGPDELDIRAGDPIAQVIFHRLGEPTNSPYRGRYQDQDPGPQPARLFGAGETEDRP